MARYLGPQTKIARKFGEPIFGADKAFEKKKYPPGTTRTKQKDARKPPNMVPSCWKSKKPNIHMALLERQFSNTFKKAVKKKGITGEILLQLLESRLDNVVYRLGIAPSRRGCPTAGRSQAYYC
jgi:small subunit ribosomal protein S4